MIYYYKDKPYKILTESKIKSLEDLTAGEWLDVVIYESLYDHPNGKIWVRFKDNFYSKFKTKE